MVDYAKLPPETIALISRAEKNSPAAQQVRTLSSISDLLQMMLEKLDRLNTTSTDATSLNTDALATVTEAIDDLRGIVPELPDYSGPIVKAVAELEKKLSSELSKLELAPTIEGPSVNVEAPAVDLKGVEKVIRQDLAKAFNEAIKNIPKTEVNVPETDLTAVEERMAEVVEWLESIDTASRLKTPFPSSFEVSNVVETNSSSYDLQVDDTGTYTYLGNAAPGTATSAAAWRIKRVTNATGVITHADGDSSFNKTWTARATYSY